MNNYYGDLEKGLGWDPTPMECAKRRRIRVALALIDHVDEEESHVEMMMDFVYAAAVLHVHQQRSLDDRAAADAISIPRVVRERWGELRKHKLDADTRVLKAGCPEVLFVKSMRMRRSTFDALVDKCWLAADEYRDRHDRDGAPASRDHQRGARLKSTMQKEIAVSLYVLSGQESFDRVGWIWSVPPSQVSEYLWRFVGVVAELATEMITWPSSEEERAEVMEEFQRVSRLPFCVGAVDGCHIEIEAPKHHARDYICYKARNTIILLAVCDHNGRFRRVEVGYPGANNDAHVFQKTGMHEFLERECLGVQPRTHIVGDAAFELREHTLVGFERLTTVIMERLTNAAIDKARVKIVNAFSRLKNRWRCTPSRAPHVSGGVATTKIIEKNRNSPSARPRRLLARCRAGGSSI